MVSFYDEVRADECNLDEDGDMLLFQRGIYDWGDGEYFENHITRQFIFPQQFEDDEEEWEEDAMWQLSFTLKYPPGENMRILEAGNRWRASPIEIKDFREFVKNNMATKL